MGLVFLLNLVALAADPGNPVDEKLHAAYQRIRFGQQYPPAAVQYIQERLQDAQRPVEVLETLSKDQRLEVRSLVALLLGEYGDSAGVKILWTMTRDEFESVRLTAAGALTRLSHLTSVPANVDGLQDERASVRRLTASTLAALGDKGAEDALIDALQDEDALVRTDVVKALDNNASATDKSLPSLVEMLHDPSVNVRDRTAKVLGTFHNTLVVDPLVSALKDSDWHVRAGAALSLKGWVRSNPSVVEPLLEVLKSDNFALVRDRAADSLSEAGDDEKVAAALVAGLCAEQRDVRYHAAQAIMTAKAVRAIPLLMQQRGNSNPEVREKIMEIFGRLGGSEQLPAIIEATSDPEPQVRLAAVGALRRLRELGVTGELTSKLKDQNPHVRAASARALGDLGDKTVAGKIVPLLQDSDGYVRGAAAEALGRLGDRSAVAPLIQVLGGDRQRIEGEGRGLVIGSGAQYIANLELTELQLKTRVIETLGLLRATEAVEPIIEQGLKSEDSALRATAAFALGQIGDVRAVNPLQDAVRPYYMAAPIDLDYVINPGGSKVADETRRMKERESRVRASVVWALGQIGDPSAKETLLKAVNDQNSLVRDAALEALARITEKEEERQIATDGGSAKKPTEKPQ